MRTFYNTLLLFTLATTLAFAQEKSPSVNYELVQVQDSIYMLKGRGGNIGVSFGEDGILMIDDQFANGTPAILNKLRTLSDKPVKFLINTHHHGDHTGGNENMAEKGATIIAHENVRKRLIKPTQAVKKTTKAQDLADTGVTPPKETVVDTLTEEQKYRQKQMTRKRARGNLKKGAPDGALPVLTFPTDLKMYHNGEEIMLLHISNSHTDGDAIVYFTNSNVIHTGDAFIAGKYPFIDVRSGGSLNGYIRGLDRIIMMCDAKTKIIPGHGPVAKVADVKSIKSLLVFLRDRITFHIVNGKTKEEIIAMTDMTKTYDDQGYGDGFISKESLIANMHSIIMRNSGEKLKARAKGKD